MFLIRIPWCFLLHWVTHLCCCCPTSPTTTTTTSTFVFLLWKYPQNKHAHTHIADKILGSHNPPSLLAAKTNKQTNKHPQIKEWKRIFRRKKKNWQNATTSLNISCPLLAFNANYLQSFFFSSFASISLSHNFWVVDLFGFIMHSCYLLSEIWFIYLLIDFLKKRLQSLFGEQRCHKRTRV